MLHVSFTVLVAPASYFFSLSLFLIYNFLIKMLNPCFLVLNLSVEIVEHLE